MTVSDGEREVMLDEICWSELSEMGGQLLLGVAVGNDLPENLPENFEYYLYTIYDFNNTSIGEAGKTYFLKIRITDEKELSATVYIPRVINLDSIWAEQHKETTYSDFWRLYVTLNDPQTLGNYYRYYTRVGENVFLLGRSSVFDDLAINGKTFHFLWIKPFYVQMILTLILMAFSLKEKL